MKLSKLSRIIIRLMVIMSALLLCVYMFSIFNSDLNIASKKVIAETNHINLVNEVFNMHDDNLSTKDLNTTTDILINTKYIENSSYFMKNPLHHKNDGSDNPEGTCTTVAMQMLLGYHNYNSDRRLIPALSEEGVRFLSSDYGNLLEHPDIADKKVGFGNPSFGTQDAVYDEIFNLTTWPEFPGLGQNVFAIADAANKFVKKHAKDIKDEVSIKAGFISLEDVKRDLNMNLPVVLGFDPIRGGDEQYHVVPVYGYATINNIEGFIFHYGAQSLQTHMWAPASWFGFQIRMSVNHVHDLIDTGNTINLTHREHLCNLCGLNTIKPLYKTNSLGNEIIGTNYNLSGEITIPKAINGIVLTGIGANAFAKQKERIELKKIQFEYDNQINYIGKNAFANLLIEEIVLPKNLVRIEDNSFANCRNLKHISSIDNIQNIGKFAFKDCKLLTNFMVSPKVQSIGEGAFAGCDNLNISVSTSNKNYSATNNILYNKEKTKLLSGCKISSEIKLLESIIEIAPYAFDGNSNLRVVHFYHNPIIGESAFANCANLSNVYFYSYDIPTELGINCFANNEFILYTPHICQETYQSRFSEYTNNISSISAQIFYNSDGNIIKTEEIYYGSIINNLPIPTKTGYEFLGWYDNENYDGDVYQNGGLWDTTVNKTLYAKWEAKKYSIIFAGQQSSGLEPKTVTFDSEIGDLPNLTQIGYTFLGWKAENGEFYNEDTIWDQTSDIVLTSEWSANEYTITLNANEGILDGANSFTVKYNEQFFTTTKVMKTGNIFEGWYDNNNVQYITSTGLGTRKWDKPNNDTLYARWTAKSYTIQILDEESLGAIMWIGPEGKLSDVKCSIQYGDKLNAINLIASFKKSQYGTKTGQIFDHFEYSDKNIDWETVPDLGENNSIINIVPVWVDEEHVIYFNTGFELTLPRIKQLFAMPIQLPENVNRAGHTFLGWKTEKNVDVSWWTTMPDLTPGVQNNGSITLFAMWELNRYAVTYNANGGSGYMATSTYYYQVAQNLTANNFSKVGYTFAGWSESPNGSVKYGDRQSISIEGNITLYAQWSPNRYTVTLEQQGGSGGTSSVQAIYGESLPSYKIKPNKSGYDFAGYYSLINGGGKKYYDANMNGVNIWNETNGGTIYAYWTPSKFNVILDKQNGTGGTSEIIVTFSEPMVSAEKPSRTGFHFQGYYSGIDGKGVQYYDNNMNSVKNWDVPGNATLYAKWVAKTEDVSINYIEGDVLGNHNFIKSSEKIVLAYDSSIRIAAPSIDGYSFKKWVVRKGYPKVDPVAEQYTTSESFRINYSDYIELRKGYKNLSFYAVYTSNCVAEGTMITLADGSQKAVEKLTGNEQLLVWNLKTGKFDTAPILFIDSDVRKEYEVVNLYFSDGTTVKVIGEHAFWDVDLNQYVFLRNDAAKYIGHWFNKQTTDANGHMTWTNVQLSNVVVQKEYTTAWSPVTYGHLCYYVNGMLSMPGATEGLINIFDVDSNTMKIIETAYDKDIEKYGLFTYEEFIEIIEIPEEMFTAFNGQYLKVAIGKGLTTIDELIVLINKYIGMM